MEISRDNAALERADEQLVARCRAGDSSAWDELVDRYQRLVYAVPRRAGLSDEQAEDIFQEVFLTLFQKLDDIQQPGKIRAWFVTTAKFKTWAVIRGSKGFYSIAETEEELDREMESLRDASPLADDTLIEMEEQHLIRTAVSKLDERCRTIIQLLYLATRPSSYATVGDAIGVGETSISPLRTRCLKKLEKLLSG